MMDFLACLISDNEQDRAACEQWWRESSDADKLHVWGAIARPYDDPAEEIMSRFAQLAFAEMAERMQREREGA